MVNKIRGLGVFYLSKILELFNFRLVKSSNGFVFERNLFFNEFRIYRSLLNTSNKLTIVDIGSHVGNTVSRFMKEFPNSEIHAFEPASDSFKILRSKFSQNPKVFLNNVAIGDSETTKNLYLLGDLSTGNSLISPSDTSKVKQAERVNVISLGQYCKKRNIDEIDILKIDTQGYEKECLEGSLDIIKKDPIKVIKLEIMFHNTYQRISSFYQIEKILDPYGYYLHDICWIKKSSTQNRTLVVDAIYTKTS